MGDILMTDASLEEVRRGMRQMVAGTVGPINQRLDMAPWNDGVRYGGAAHREEFWGGGAGFPWGSNYTFGITRISADKLKVWKGKFRRWGDQTYVATDTEVTFYGDGDQWLVWRWSEDSGLEIVTTPQTNYPAEADSTYIYGPIHKVNLTGGVFTLLDSVQTGIINAPKFTVAGA